MKSILLLRHGKSDWKDPKLDDLRRPLAERGRKDAPRMGRALRHLECVPDLILSSPALRARQTARLVAKACGYDADLQVEQLLYASEAQAGLETLRSLPSGVQQPLVVGHNPLLEELAGLLLGPGCRTRIPTAGLLCLQAPEERWLELQPGCATLLWFLLPRLLKSLG